MDTSLGTVMFRFDSSSFVVYVLYKIVLFLLNKIILIMFQIVRHL